MAATFSPAGGTANASNLPFVKPVNTLAAGLVDITTALTVIGVIVVIGQHMLHREDWGGMVRNVVFVAIAGAIVLAAANLLGALGASAATF